MHNNKISKQSYVMLLILIPICLFSQKEKGISKSKTIDSLILEVEQQAKLLSDTQIELKEITSKSKSEKEKLELRIEELNNDIATIQNPTIRWLDKLKTGIIGLIIGVLIGVFLRKKWWEKELKKPLNQDGLTP